METARFNHDWQRFNQLLREYEEITPHIPANYNYDKPFWARHEDGDVLLIEPEQKLDPVTNEKRVTITCWNGRDPSNILTELLSY